MKLAKFKSLNLFLGLGILFLFSFCTNNEKPETMNEKVNILFLHHSTGKQIWRGGTSKVVYKLTKVGNVQKWFLKYNKEHETEYVITEQNFPKKEPYGWSNYPYDYYNIWVKNAGDEYYMDEPTLEILTKEYNAIIWKHCFPVGKMVESKDPPDIDSPERTIENYKLQYEALKKKMLKFPDTKFLVWTGAALVENNTNKRAAELTRSFFDWVTKEWDEPGDNIFLWDFYELQTEGGIYFKDEYAESPDNSHPSAKFSRVVYPYFCKRIVDVITGDADNNPVTGK